MIAKCGKDCNREDEKDNMTLGQIKNNWFIGSNIITEIWRMDENF